MIQINDITAVILAGGKGRRLGGQDKGLVNYKGRPLIEHILHIIKPQVQAIMINANRNLERYAEYGFPVINDDLTNFQGPLAGFISAMKAVSTTHILTLPCDGPKIPPDYSQRLLSALETQNEETINNTIVVAHDGERMQPVHALIPTGLAASLEAFLEKGDRKIDLWYAQHPVVLADFSDIPDVFQNINTEEQRRKLEQDEPHA